MRYPWDVFQKCPPKLYSNNPYHQNMTWILGPKKPLKTLYHDRLQQPQLQHLESVQARRGHRDPCNSACRSFWTCTPKSSQRESQTSIMDWNFLLDGRPQKFDQNSGFHNGTPKLTVPWVELSGKKRSWKFKGKNPPVANRRQLKDGGNMVATKLFSPQPSDNTVFNDGPFEGGGKNYLQQTRNKASWSYLLQLFLQS